MRHVILYSAVTIDGYIARKDGSVDWLDAYSRNAEGDDYGYADFISTIDTTIMGYATFELAQKLDGMASMAGFTNFVLTRRKDRDKAPFVTFLSGDVADSISRIKKEKGKNIWLLGGGQINSLLVGAGLLDEMVLTTIPIILGDGIPLFSPPAPESAFELRSSRSFPNGLVQSVYRKNSHT